MKKHPSSRECRRPTRGVRPWPRASSGSPAPSSRCASVETHTSTAENPPRTPAPTRASPPSVLPDPSPLVSRAAVACHQPSVCTGDGPPSPGTRPLAIQFRSPPRSARPRTARCRGSTGCRLPRRRGSSSLVATPPVGRHSYRDGHTGRENAYPVLAWLPPIADVAVLGLSRAAYRRRGL